MWKKIASAVPGVLSASLLGCVSLYRESVMNTDPILAQKLGLWGKWGAIFIVSFYPFWGLWWCFNNLKVTRKKEKSEINGSFSISEKTRMDYWFEFLDLKICQAKKLY